MKKIARIIASLILGVSISFSPINGTVLANSSVYLEHNEWKEIMLAQSSAIEACGSIYENFEKNKNGEYIYPSEYGGEYINDSNKLVVQLTDTSIETQKKYIDFANNMDDIIFNQVDYSMNELQEIQDSFCELIDSYGIVGIGIDNEKNIVQVSVLEDKIYEFSMYMKRKSKLPIEFKVGEYAKSHSSMIGGDELIAEGYSSTLGCCGYYNGQPAILTSGHGVVLDRPVYLGSQYIGIAEVSQYATQQYGDYSIIPVTGSNVSLTNKVHGDGFDEKIYGSRSSGYVPQGTIVFKYGKVSGIAYLKVGIKDSYSFEGVWIKGLIGGVLVQGSTIDGDSGGPVCMYVSGRAYMCGTYTGSGNYDQCFISPMDYPISLGFSVKTN